MQSSLSRGDENLRDLFGRATARGFVREKGYSNKGLTDQHIFTESVRFFGERRNSPGWPQTRDGAQTEAPVRKNTEWSTGKVYAERTAGTGSLRTGDG